MLFQLYRHTINILVIKWNTSFRWTLILWYISKLEGIWFTLRSCNDTVRKYQNEKHVILCIFSNKNEGLEPPIVVCWWQQLSFFDCISNVLWLISDIFIYGMRGWKGVSRMIIWIFYHVWCNQTNNMMSVIYCLPIIC